MRDYRLYIKDMLAAMDSIESFVRGLDEQAFQVDDKTSSAVVRKLEGQKRTFYFLKSWRWHPANDEEKTSRH